ncbi:MAG: sigma 54-interacting transcriptional regulator, partial [Myxococcales bacterium]|nr:sigma 54-interacting transcriptional regulator [Myxococcales bacterium]
MPGRPRAHWLRRMLSARLPARGWPRSAAAAAAGGRVLAETNRVDDALALYEQSAARATSDAEAARALAAVGRLQARQSRHKLALTALRGALERGGAALSGRDRAEVLATLARCGVMTGALDEAAAWSDEGLALAEGAPATVGQLRYSRGLVAWYRGDFERAKDDFEAALAATRESGDLVEQAAAVTGLGLVAHRREDYGAALAAYREALQLGEQAGDDARVLSALQNLGVVFHERGEWIAALDAYKEALGLAEALDQPGRVVQLAGNLGNLWRYLGELDAARDVLQRGLERARADGNRYMEAVILNLLADVASDGESWATAERLWLDAIAVTVEASCATEEGEARLNLARLHLERRSHDEARRALVEGRRVCERLETKKLACLGSALAAGIERQAVGGDLKRARVELDLALAALTEVTNPDFRWPVLLEAMWLARDEGDLQQAMERALEVRGILQKQLDTVPARHRQAFRARRDRRDAWRETLVFADLQKLRGGGSERDTAWIRLLEVNKRLATEHSVTQLLEYIMDSAIVLTGAERGFLLLDDEADDGIALDVRVARNLDQENIKKKQLKISHGIARRVIEEGAAVITVDAMEDERYKDQLSVHDLRLRSILCLPMRFRGSVLGAIYLDNRFRASAFSDSDLPVMEAFSDLAAIALDNARLLEAREKSQAALEKARSEVESLNKRLAGELEARTQELEDTHRVVIRQRRELVAKHNYENIIGESAPIRRVYAMMDRLLENDVPVLIEGESGTGKELVARAIHFNGARQDRPFVAVNCGAIPQTLLESELFGHVRGAFTNATTDKKGLFEAAHTGTLLLDEIGELPLDMQVKLLRVLQNGEVKKVGANRELKV